MIPRMTAMRVLRIALVFCAVLAPREASTQTQRTQVEVGVSGFVPLGDLGSAAGFDARLRGGVDLRLAIVTHPMAIASVRFALDVVPRTWTHVRPRVDCLADCVERSNETWIVAPGADLLWRLSVFRGAYAVSGVGLSIYAHRTGDCVELAGRFCPSTYEFTQNAVWPSVRLGWGARRGSSGRIGFEADDFLTPIGRGRLQNDLRFGISAWF